MKLILISMLGTPENWFPISVFLHTRGTDIGQFSAIELNTKQTTPQQAAG
jgi:hypothetical protein